MLVLPMGRQSDWRRPPLITLLLVAANVAVFFLIQQGDGRQYKAAVAYYLDSSLPDIEFPRYIAYLQERGRDDRARAIRRSLARGDGAGARVLAGMQGDGRFMARLRRNQVVTPSHPAFAEWRQARAAFEQRLERVTSQRLGFASAQPRPLNALAHMFLHGGLGQLVANMVALVLLGFVVEGVVGRLLYLGLYLFGGVIAVLAFATVYSNSAAPLVGASGAIAALMGAYAALLGLRRISFFYSFPFHSGFARAPAFLLLPLWLGMEAYQLRFGGLVNGAYMAHLGGLAGGGLVGLGLRLTGAVDPAFLDRDEREERDTADMAKGLEHLANRHLEAARQRFRSILKRNPDHREALAKLYTVASYRPDSDEYHRLAHRIFALADSDPATLRLQRDTFRDYLAHARPRMRFHPGPFLDLAGRLAVGGFPEEAEAMVRSFLETGKNHPRLPQALMLVARGLAQQSEPERARRYREVLQARFPDSEEAGEVRDTAGGQRPLDPPARPG